MNLDRSIDHLVDVNCAKRSSSMDPRVRARPQEVVDAVRHPLDREAEVLDPSQMISERPRWRPPE